MCSYRPTSLWHHGHLPQPPSVHLCQVGGDDGILDQGSDVSGSDTPSELLEEDDLYGEEDDDVRGRNWREKSCRSRSNYANLHAIFTHIRHGENHIQTSAAAPDSFALAVTQLQYILWTKSYLSFTSKTRCRAEPSSTRSAQLSREGYGPIATLCRTLQNGKASTLCCVLDRDGTRAVCAVGVEVCS